MEILECGIISRYLHFPFHSKYRLPFILVMQPFDFIGFWLIAFYYLYLHFFHRTVLQFTCSSTCWVCVDYSNYFIVEFHHSLTLCSHALALHSSCFKRHFISNNKRNPLKFSTLSNFLSKASRKSLTLHVDFPSMVSKFERYRL